LPMTTAAPCRRFHFGKGLCPLLDIQPNRD
jgi:hypothetical protein